MPVNPDPTVTSLSLPIGRGLGTLTGTVTTWEMIANVVVPSQTIALPTGRFLVTLMVVGLPGDGAPAPQIQQQDVTLASPGTATIPLTKLNHTRDFASARSVQVMLDVKIRQNNTWLPYATTGTARGIVTLAAAAVPSAGALPAFGASNGQVHGPITGFLNYPQGYLDGANSAVVTMGGTLIRDDPQWMQLCPTSTAFDAATQAVYDAYFTACAAKSLKAIVFLEPIITSPAWAATSGTRGNPPANWSDFASYVSGFLTRWGANVAAVELMNEPNIQSYPNGGGQTTPADYVNFLQHLYTAVKAYSSAMPVLAACLSLCDTTYLSSLYAQSGFKGNYDAISVHPYCVDNGQFDSLVFPPVTSDPSIARPVARQAYDVLAGITAIHDVMRTNGEGTVPIWITEMGWKTDATGTAGAFTSYDVSEAQQASFQAYAVRALCRLGYVQTVLLYTGRDTQQPPGLVNFGITDYWGNRNKPAVAALATAITGLRAGTG